MLTHYFNTLTVLCDCCKTALNFPHTLNGDDIKLKNETEEAAVQSVQSPAQSANPRSEVVCNHCEATWEVEECYAVHPLTWSKLRKSTEGDCCLCSPMWSKLRSRFEEIEDSLPQQTSGTDLIDVSESTLDQRIEKRWPLLYASWSWMPRYAQLTSSRQKAIHVSYSVEDPRARPASEYLVSAQAKLGMEYFQVLKWADDDAQPAFRPGTDMTPDDAHKAIVTQIDAWIQQDLSFRSTLTTDAGKDWYPTRLIEILDPDGSRIRVIDTKARNDIGLYCALSYRWPSGDFLKILTSNISELQADAGIPTSSLLPTFQDFIRISRDLGIRHVWIDTLCIVQDDLKDWTPEASRMADVYSHSHLTFTMNSDTDTNISPLDSLIRHVAKEISKGYAQYFLEPVEGNRGTVTDLLSTSPLASRAWCYQEKMLAKRLVHVFPSSLVWEWVGHKKQNFATLRDPSIKASLRATMKSSRGISQQPHYNEDLLDVILGRVASLEPNAHSEFGMNSETIWTEWRRCVAAYTERQLTQEADRLVAFSAVARKFQEFTGNAYVLGCFAGALRRSLSWYCAKPTTTSKYTRLNAESCHIPTWSWGAVNGRVAHWSTGCGGEHCFDAATIELYQSSIGVELGSWQDTKAIQIYGRLIPIKLTWTPGGTGYSAILAREAIFKSIGIPCKVLDSWADFFSSSTYLDLSLDQPDKPDLDGYFFVPIHMDISNGPGKYFIPEDEAETRELYVSIAWQGLVLRKSSSYPNAYERHGFVYHHVRDFKIENFDIFDLEAASLNFQQALRQKELEDGLDVLLV